MGPDGDQPDIINIPDIPEQAPVVIGPDEAGAVPNEPSVIIFDIETTGFGFDAEIIQLAAKTKKSEFGGYILPAKPIHPKASEVTGLYSTGAKLYYKGQQLETRPREEVLRDFIRWLPERALLAAHNCKSFDSILLISHLTRCCMMDDFRLKVAGFTDSLPLFKDMYPNRKTYKQSSLADDIIPEKKYNAHNANANEDVSMLYDLFSAVNITVVKLLPFSFTVSNVERRLEIHNQKAVNMNTFKDVIKQKVLSKSMCERAAGTGLSLTHLKCAFRRSGVDGVNNILGEKMDNNKPRVTNQKKIIKQLCDYLAVN